MNRGTKRGSKSQAAKSRRDGKSAEGHDRVAYAVIGQGHFAQSAILPAFAGAEGCELRAIFSSS